MAWTATGGKKDKKKSCWVCGCVRGVNIISVEAILFKYDVIQVCTTTKKKDVFEYVCVTFQIYYSPVSVEATFL